MDTLSETGRARTTLVELQQKIRQESRILFHVTYVRKLMYKAGLSSKTTSMVPDNRAGNGTVNS